MKRPGAQDTDGVGANVTGVGAFVGVAVGDGVGSAEQYAAPDALNLPAGHAPAQ